MLMTPQWCINKSKVFLFHISFETLGRNMKTANEESCSVCDKTISASHVKFSSDRVKWVNCCQSLSEWTVREWLSSLRELKFSRTTVNTFPISFSLFHWNSHRRATQLVPSWLRRLFVCDRYFQKRSIPVDDVDWLMTEGIPIARCWIIHRESEREK